mgnify:CR=1 FL=1
MSVPSAIILGMEKWYKYSYVCPDCDALIEYTIKQTDIPLDVNMFNYKCVCGGNATTMSVVDATIYSTQQKEEQTMETMTDNFMQTKIIELEDIISRHNSALTTHQNCDYWKSENGRIGRQLIELVNDAITGEYEANDVINAICEIIDYQPKKTIEFTATMKFTGQIEVDLMEAEDFDLESALNDAYVDINNGDVVIDNYELYDAEEC